MSAREPSGETSPILPPDIDAAARVTPERKKGRPVSDAFLRKVAAAYRAAGDSIAGITPDLDPAFNASEPTKYRWVRHARKRGLLEPREG
jgi:hypothetical protein